jgi:hypothetical protein
MTESELYKRWQKYSTTCEEKELPPISWGDWVDGYYATKEDEQYG